VVDDGFAWWPSVSAVELALAAGAKRVTLVTPGAAFATGIPHESRAQLMPRLRGLALAMRPLTMLQAAGDGWLDLRATTSATVERLEVDAAIVVGERRPRDRSAFVADGGRTIIVGDAIVPRRASHAIAEGRAAARVLAGTRTDAVVA
jgi:2,4-dienoyl-CoA reductase (NADPH2)